MLLPNARPDLTQFNADDSENYLALSYALTKGFGYTRSLVAGLYVPHTTWPPGFPVLLAPLTFVMGLPLNFLYLKLYMISIGLSGVALAWIYVRRITDSSETADLAALLLFLLPFYWLFSRSAMTEVPTVAFLLFALTLMDFAWAQRTPHAPRVAIAGFISGFGMLLRGTNVCLLIVPLAYALGQRRAIAKPLHRFALLLLHGAAFVVPSLLWAIRNRGIDRSNLGFDGIDQMRMLLVADPVDQASPMATPTEILTHALYNIGYKIIYRIPEQILPGLWNAEWWTWHGAPFIALVLTAMIVLATIPRRASALPLFLTIIVYDLILGIYVWGGSVRFWVPVTSLMTILLAVNTAPLLARLRFRRRLVVVVAIASVFGANLFVFARNFEAKPYLGNLGDLVAIFDRIGALPSAPRSVYTDHSLLFTLRTGLPAPMTVEAMHVTPSYTHLVLCDPKNDKEKIARITSDATLMLSQGVCRYYALQKPTMAQDLAVQ